MPGEEITGLVMGGIALAALFTTCVELFDYFELGKNYVYDYTLACTKIELLRARLRAWGITLRVTEPGGEDPVLRFLWPATGEVVRASLSALTTILRSSEVLMQKYELRRDKSRNWSHDLKKRSIWAIHDKTKFDLLISDLAFFIENLEKVASQINDEKRVLENQTAYTKRQGNKFNQKKRPFTKRADRPSSDDSYQSQTEADFKEYQFGCTGQEDQAFRGRHIISGRQHNSDTSIGVLGVIGSTGGTCWIGGVQINSQRAVGLQGVISPEALAYLQDRAAERERCLIEEM